MVMRVEIKNRSALNKISGTCFFLSLLLSLSCAEEKEEKNEVYGAWKATLVRAQDQSSWSEVKGESVLQFFKAGVFRQTAQAYVEPQFYSEIVACTGQASGKFTTENASNGEPVSISLEYEALSNIAEGSACRMNSRKMSLQFVERNTLDVWDSQRVVRYQLTGSLE
jgi:hypothetical protein